VGSSARTRRRQVTVLCGVQFIDVLGVTSALTAIPAMLAGVSAPVSATAILATVYAMFFGGLLIVGARLGDRFGHRRVLLAGSAAFVMVAVVGATAQEVIQLVAARGLQGGAAAVSVPCALRLLLDAAPKGSQRQTALAAWSATGAAAGTLGYLVGGVLTDTFGWPAVFLVNVPVGVALLLAVWRQIPRSAPDPDRSQLDLAGAVLLVASVMALIVGASLAEEPARRVLGLSLTGAGLAVAGAFAVRQRHAKNPLVPRPAWAAPNLRTGTLVSFINTATTSSAAVLATLLLQQQLGVSAVDAGFALLPFSLGVIAGSALSRPLGKRLPPRRLAAAGLGGIAIGNLVLALTYGSIAGVVAGVVVAGIGLGISSVAGTSIGTDVDHTLTGAATGLLNTGAQLGTAIGVAALLVLANSINLPWPGTAMAWIVAAVLAGCTALLLATRDHRSATGPDPAPPSHTRTQLAAEARRRDQPRS
jgi:MFS family permease